MRTYQRKFKKNPKIIKIKNKLFLMKFKTKLKLILISKM